MSSPNNTREVLIAEAVGDLTRLLDRADALRAQLDGTCGVLTQAHASITTQGAVFEQQLTNLLRQAKLYTAKHVMTCADEAARQNIEAQTRALNDIAQQVLRAELAPLSIRAACGSAQPWKRWLPHLATAAVASAGTWLLRDFAFASCW